jgi:hypothetical protein
MIFGIAAIAETTRTTNSEHAKKVSIEVAGMVRTF